jgi:hypothetical protein
MADAKAKAARESAIKDSLRALASDKASERRKAVLYLGEAAHGDAVHELIDRYENDTDKSVRQAARYALGQFKAIDVALSRGQQQKVERFLNQVETQGRLGRRAPIGSAVQVLAILVVLFFILAAAAIFAPQIRERLAVVQSSIQAVSAPRQSRADLSSAIGAYVTALRQDELTLRQTYLRLPGGDALSCDATFNAPARFVIHPDDAAANPDLNQVIVDLNDLRQTLIDARLPYDEACAGTRELTAADVGTLLQPLLEPQTRLTEIYVAQTYVPALDGLIATMIDRNGSAERLIAYWRDANNTGITVGCTVPTPDIPDDVTLPDEDRQLSPNLEQAVAQINVALAATRTGYTELAQLCGDNALVGGAHSGQINNAQAAFDSFSLARQILGLITQGML